MNIPISAEKLHYLRLLSELYPSIRAVTTEIINLQAILNLPKGTEHFLSDIHGEYEAFVHIMNNCSGVIREKVQLVFGESMDEARKDELCTLIYYPQRKLSLLREQGVLSDGWYMQTLLDLIAVCRAVSAKYTRSKVRKALPAEYSYIIDELLHAYPDENNPQQLYHRKILEAILSTRSADDFIGELSALIKRIAVDRLHIVGDIYDRGPYADQIMDLLCSHHNVDVQWGNHDILWMGAAAGSEACMVAAVRNSVTAGNYTFLESGYGISLRPLAIFAEATYPDEPLSAAVTKAISVILFKLEGQIILRRSEFEMEDRLLLDKIDRVQQTVRIGDKTYSLKDVRFPTVDVNDPYKLSEWEQQLMDHFKEAFAKSTRLHRHVKFLYQNGGLYRTHNGNLLFHGCIPLDADGSLTQVKWEGRLLSGRDYLDALEKTARRAYFDQKEKLFCQDSMWYLWCGRKSPLFGREKMTTFERMFIDSPASHTEVKNPYYALCEREEVCDRLLQAFGLYSQYAHIVNGHVPVRASDGESPVKANGKLIFIDGGFCKAYQKTTGIAGYTLIYNSQGMRILSHQPFSGIEQAVSGNDDIHSATNQFETQVARVMVMDTDDGELISNKVFDLSLLLEAYRQGVLVTREKD